MITTLVRSQTLAVLPNSRWKTPMVPGPHTSWVMSTSVFTQTLSPAWTRCLPAARARIFSVNVIRKNGSTRTFAFRPGTPLRTFVNRYDMQRIDLCDRVVLPDDEHQTRSDSDKIGMRHPHPGAITEPKGERPRILVES